MLRLVRPLVLVLALLWLVHGLHPTRLHVSHAAFHNALCVCPVCWVDDGLQELSFGEYC